MNEEEVRKFWDYFDWCYRTAEQRKGQAMMNALRRVAPELYDEVSGTSRDCFYRDDQVFALRDWLGI